MRYESAAAFRSALEARLKDRAGRDRLPHLRKQVVFERLLARLMEVAPSRFVLKGAVALEFRGGRTGRTTNDMDFGAEDEEEVVTEHMLSAASLDLGDHFVFRVERVVARENEAGRTVRYRVEAELAGRSFDTVLVDVGLAEVPLWMPEQVVTPGILEFADIAAVSVPAISLEQQVAEKLHAYTRLYEGGRRSSRVKDLVDILTVASRHQVRADRLREAIHVIFERRGTHDAPDRAPEPPEEWRPALKRLIGEATLDEDVESGLARVSAFLDPVLRGEASGLWDHGSGEWRA